MKKKMLSVFLAIVMVVGMLPGVTVSVKAQSTPESSDTRMIYFNNDENWEGVYAYYWGGSASCNWPGIEMANVSGTIFSLEIPADTVNIIFNNGTGAQTADLVLSTDGENLYTYSTGTWSVYDAGNSGGEEDESPATVTVYFDNTAGWAKVNAYYWGGSASPVWPGIEMTQVSETIFSVEIPADAVNIIFNNGSGAQTADLTIPTDGKNLYTYSSDTWSEYDAGNSGGEEEESPATVTVYFDNTAGWAKVNAYYWGGSASPVWPGIEMTQVSETIFSVEIPADAVNIIFNDGSGAQTADLTIPTDGKDLYTYSTGTWSEYDGSSSGETPDPDTLFTLYFKNTGNWGTVNIYACAGDSSLTGSWPGTSMTDMGDGIWSYSVPATATMVIFNDGSNQTNDLTIPADSSDLYDPSTDTWSVYGEVSETCTVTVAASPAEGGIVAGGGTYAKNSSATVTAAAYGDYAFVRWLKNDQTVSLDTSITFTVTEDTALTAVFEKVTPGTGSTDENALSIYRGTRTDLRDESVYTLMISRFYDGDSGNNVHCWDDGYAGNPDSDPAWRGDFKGLIEKLDYIKALGFTAIRLNSVVQNASGYDYHGFHPINLKEIDFRLESDGYTYEDLIDACHARGLKVIQYVVLNHTSNFGEEYLRKLFELNEDTAWSITESLIPTELLLESYPDYAALDAAAQFQARLDVLKAYITESLNADEYYHREKNMGYESPLEQQGMIAGDCVDVNTENPEVALYLAESCAWYAQMGVDAIYIDFAKHINRWTFNEGILPLLNDLLENAGLELDIFYEVVSRARETWNYNIPSSSVPFYSWAETEEEWQGNWNDTHPTANIQTSIDHYNAHCDPAAAPTSDNAFLDSITYHTPDYSQSNGMKAFDFTMMWNFENATNAFRAGLAADPYMNDATWNITSVDSWDYGPDGMEKTRYSLGVQAWMENLNLMFTFRGIPSILYGTEIEFANGLPIDVGPNAPLSQTGRAYYGDHLNGTVTATDFGEYEATGKVAETLNSTLSQHIRMLNALRMKIPALRKGQYTVDSQYVSGSMAFIKRYTVADIDSLALVTISGGATFKNIPNGKYIDAVSGNVINVSNGTLTTPTITSGNLAVYVCCASGFTGLDAEMPVAESVLRFNVNGDTTAVNSITTKNGTVVLPAAPTLPESCTFLGWIVNGETYQPGDTVEISVDSMARISHDCKDENKDHDCDYCGDRISEHQYGNATFNWAEDLSAATYTMTCSGCAEGTEGHEKTKNCTVTVVSENGKLIITASSDNFSKTLEIYIENNVLKLPEELTAAAIFMAASYNADGRMTDIQILEKGETLTLSGTIKVFFLNGNYVPILPNTEG